MFSTLSKINFNFSVKSFLSSANAFNLGQSKIFKFGKELTHYQTTNCKLKEFADDNFDFDENGRKLSKQVEQFLLFPQCFLKACFPGASKDTFLWEWVKEGINVMVKTDTHVLGFSTFKITEIFHSSIIEWSFRWDFGYNLKGGKALECSRLERRF